ncbi:MAG: hypothetical protein RR297_01010 [Clostridia bacterium]
MLREEHALISKAAAQAQQSLNDSSGIELKAIETPLNIERVQGLVHKVSNATTFEEVSWMLNEPLKIFSQSIVDDTLMRNVEFQSKAGLRPRIIRCAESRCCE